jgi:hypothetical protein
MSPKSCSVERPGKTDKAISGAPVGSEQDPTLVGKRDAAD